MQREVVSGGGSSNIKGGVGNEEETFGVKGVTPLKTHRFWPTCFLFCFFDNFASLLDFSPLFFHPPRNFRGGRTSRSLKILRGTRHPSPPRPASAASGGGYIIQCLDRQRTFRQPPKFQTHLSCHKVISVFTILYNTLHSSINCIIIYLYT